MSEPNDNFTPPMTAEALQEAERWKEDRQRLLGDFKKISLRILVWGPGDFAQADVARIYKKRQDIRDALRREGFTAFFSEEIKDDGLESVSVKTQEFFQALSADLIIILTESAWGATGEFHGFAQHPDLIRKILLMFPQKYSSGYNALGDVRIASGGFGAVYDYEDEEIESCNVLTKALECANMRREHVAFLRMRSMV
jgi:hypothetical protein